MIELKRLTEAGIPAALEKAEQYRLLNQPWAAESICLDIVAIQPDHQHALRTLLLARTDRFGTDGGSLKRARETLQHLKSPYERAYYAGLIFERLAKSQLDARVPAAPQMAWQELKQAMACYEEAEALRPNGDDDAILRWNTCARLLNESPHIRPRHDDPEGPVLGE
ncbi:MAG TPA: hypothetical protein VGK20_02180 [Candidatus Binatia bacterium]|jgi:hypothetical protein